MATEWLNFVNELLEQDPDLVPDELLWSRMRYRRDQLLTECDWTQLPDAPVDKVAWGNYRQALRDLPTTYPNPRDVVFPEKP